MSLKMNRGKHQILFNYLPGKTFDFEKVATISRVTSVKGVLNTNLNIAILLRKISEEVRAWRVEFRPGLRDDILKDTNRFILIDPQGVESEMFPKVFWCDNRNCGMIYDYSQSDSLPPKVICPRCKQGRLKQLRFVTIHSCGALHPLHPPTCSSCHSKTAMCLEPSGERISNFLWICRNCNTTMPVFGGWCSECDATGQNRRMDIEVHRAGRTYYSHSTVLLNVPQKHLDSFLNIPEWVSIVAAKFFSFPELSGKKLSDFTHSVNGKNESSDSGLSATDLDSLLQRQASGELSVEQFIEAMKDLRKKRQTENESISPVGIMQMLESRTGVPRIIWERAGHEILEAVLPFEFSHPRDVFIERPRSHEVLSAQQIGLSHLSLLSDFPIITATYGFSRTEYTPNQSRLNPFPPEREYRGKLPIFVDQIQADAVFISFDVNRIFRWLEINGVTTELPNGSDPNFSRSAYFVHLFDDVQFRETIQNNQPQARMVFSLLHTLSHLFVRQAALLCGLDTTSLSEYILPKALSFAIYSNHRFGATIGALTALYEQSINEWLNAVKESIRCIYDPVCFDKGSNCHACTHLPETSCRYFNLNLSRAMLFGGPDAQLGNISYGYFDNSI